tara:strand:+ start:204 stop:341 length:138 start_codon:yes stop_codon:yes gene_type:complete
MSAIAVILGALFTSLFLFTAYLTYLFYRITTKFRVDHLEIKENKE